MTTTISTKTEGRRKRKKIQYFFIENLKTLKQTDKQERTNTCSQNEEKQKPNKQQKNRKRV